MPHHGLSVPMAKLDELQHALSEWEKEGWLKGGELRCKPSVGTQGPERLWALLELASAAAAVAYTPKIKAVAAKLGGELVAVDSLPGSARQQFDKELEHYSVRAPASPRFEGAFNALRQAVGGPPTLRLGFAGPDDLLAAWAKHVAEGALFVPSSRAPPAPELRLCFSSGEEQFPGQRAKVVERSPPGSHPGFWLEVTPNSTFSAFIEKQAQKQHEGRRSSPGLSERRATPRYETVLEVAFESNPELVTEYASNISRGGMFIRTTTPPPMRSRVQIQLKLPQGEVVSLPAEVVHVSPIGVGVAFSAVAPEVLAPIEALVAQYEQRRPKVLVVDDGASWRAQLVAMLERLGCDVEEASDGRSALLKLIDGFFELDLVLADLYMPELDGRQLLERIRTQGGETGLKVIVFSVADPSESADLTQRGATAVLSKRLPMDQVAHFVARQLGIDPKRAR